MSTNVEELVHAYLAIRTERERVENEFKAADAALKADLVQIEAMMLSVCNDLNVDSLKTQFGTVMRKLNERYYGTDWDSFRKFELEHPEWDLRERRIHQGNFKTFLSEHEGSGLPPGVNVQREFGITVRKAS